MMQESVWEKFANRNKDLIGQAGLSGPSGDYARAKLEKLDPKWQFKVEAMSEEKRNLILARRVARRSKNLPERTELENWFAQQGTRDPDTGYFTPGEGKRYTSKEYFGGINREGHEIDLQHLIGSQKGKTEEEVARELRNFGMEQFEIDYARNADAVAFEKKYGLGKFKKEYHYNRAKYFESIAPERFNRGLLNRLQLERRGGDWYQNVTTRDFNQLPIDRMKQSDVPIGRQTPGGVAETTQKVSGRVLEEDPTWWKRVRNLVEKEEGPFKPVEGSPKEFSTKLAPGEFGKIMSEHEMSMRYKDLDFVSSEERHLYKRNASDIITGQSQNKVYYMTQEAQAAHAGEFFEQWAYLKGSKGETVPLGKHTITGRLNADASEMLADAAERVIQTKNPASGVKKLVGEYYNLQEHAQAFGLDDKFFRQMRSLIEPMHKDRARASFVLNLNEAGYMAERIRRKDINVKIFEENTRKIYELIRKRTAVSKLKIVGYEAQRDYINSLTEGEVLYGPGGRRFEVGGIKGAENVTLGKGTWRDAQILEEELLKKNTFPVRLARTVKGDLSKVSVIDPIGRELGVLNEELASKLLTGPTGEVSHGMLPEPGLFGRVVQKADDRFGLELLKDTVGDFRPDELVKAGMIPNIPASYEGGIVAAQTWRQQHQSVLEDIFKAERNIGEGVSDVAFNQLVREKWPLEATKGRRLSLVELQAKAAAGVKKGAARVGQAFENVISGGERLINKRMLLIATVTAGALMLWGGKRQRSKEPLMVERDVPRSLYGSQQLTGDQSQPIYSPKTRVTPENTGYHLDVDVSTEDDVRGRDQMVLANSLSAISSNALGHQRVGSSMHIVDDSENMTKHSSARRVNEVLNA